MAKKPSPTQPATFGARLRARREALGMSPSDLGIAAGIKSPRENFKGWEGDARLPNAKFLPRLCRALGCSYEDLLGAP